MKPLIICVISEYPMNSRKVMHIEYYIKGHMFVVTVNKASHVSELEPKESSIRLAGLNAKEKPIVAETTVYVRVEDWFGLCISMYTDWTTLI